MGRCGFKSSNLSTGGMGVRDHAVRRSAKGSQGAKSRRREKKVGATGRFPANVLPSLAAHFLTL
jgi:hypothetical protein